MSQADRATPIQPLAVTLILAGLLTALPASAHDFWLTAEKSAPDAPPVLRMWVGHEMEAEEERPYEAQRSTSLRAYRAQGGPEPLAQRGPDGSIPFYTLSGPAEVPMLFAVERPAVMLSLPEPRFDHYLAEEHLTDIAALRREGAEAGPERYTRYIKALVRPPGDGPLPPAEIGQRLEIVVDSLPAQPAPGATLEARVMFEGQPLAGRSVTALQSASGSGSRGSDAVQVVETDAEGRVSFDYEQPGVWMLRLVHMRPCEACGEVLWEGFWAAQVIQSGWIIEAGEP